MAKNRNRIPQAPAGNPNDPRGMAVLLLKFLEWSRIKNFTKDTVEGRQYAINRFIRWAEERGIVQPCEVTKPILERYQRYLYHYRKKNGDPMSFRTQHGFFMPLRSWFKWLARQNHILFDPASDIEMPKLEHRLPKHILTASEAEQVLAIPDLNTGLGVRDRAILETLYSTGMRRLEIVGLRLHDVDHERGTLVVRQGKGHKDRVVPIGERALAWIERYVREVRPLLLAGDSEGDVLFLTRLGAPFGLSQMTSLARQYVNKADLGKKGSCHLWRHTAATLMLEAGADIRFIQVFLGHANLTTTEIYAQVAIRQLKAIHSACHPSAKLKRGDLERPVSLDGQVPVNQGNSTSGPHKSVHDAADDILKIIYRRDFGCDRSGREDIHRKEDVVFGHRRALIDLRLKSLIDQLWRHGCETLGCCEEHMPGRAYIQFLSPQWGSGLLVKVLRDLGVPSETTDDPAEIDVMKDGKKLGVLRLDSVRVEFPASAIDAVADSLQEHFDGLGT